MAVLASVQDRVEAWNKSVKVPQLDEESGETKKISSLREKNLAL